MGVIRRRRGGRVGVGVGDEGGELVLDIGVWVEGTEVGEGGWNEDGAGILEEAEWATGVMQSGLLGVIVG